MPHGGVGGAYPGRYWIGQDSRCILYWVLLYDLSDGNMRVLYRGHEMMSVRKGYELERDFELEYNGS